MVQAKRGEAVLKENVFPTFPLTASRLKKGP